MHKKAPNKQASKQCAKENVITIVHFFPSSSQGDTDLRLAAPPGSQRPTLVWDDAKSEVDEKFFRLALERKVSCWLHGWC